MLNKADCQLSGVFRLQPLCMGFLRNFLFLSLLLFMPVLEVQLKDFLFGCEGQKLRPPARACGGS